MFMHPYISSEIARDRQRERLARASRQRLAKACRKEFNRPGTFMIGVAFPAAVRAAAMVLSLTKAHGDADRGAEAAAATVSMPDVQPVTQA
jgi:hypothetical protein